jgi:hypothetical protein
LCVQVLDLPHPAPLRRQTGTKEALFPRAARDTSQNIRGVNLPLNYCTISKLYMSIGFLYTTVIFAYAEARSKNATTRDEKRAG